MKVLLKPASEIPFGSILGLNWSGCHDSSVSAVTPGGEPLFACSLERVSRVKHDGRFPSALLEGLDLSRFAVCALPFYARDAIPEGPTGQAFHGLRHGGGPSPLLTFPPHVEARLAEVPLPKAFVGHQLSHAASAYYSSGFARATVLTYDAGMFNCPWFGGVFQGEGPQLAPVEYFPATTNARIASLYAIVTGLLGFVPLRHEGKVTGLAAHGRPQGGCRRVLESLLTDRYGEMESAGRWVNAFEDARLPQFAMDACARRRLRAELECDSDADVAATLQQITEEHVLETVQRAKDELPAPALCLAGGLFANVRLNQRVAELWGGEIFVAPPMGDEGVSLGAALLVAHCRSRTPPRATTMFLGPAPTTEDVSGALAAADMVAQPLSEDAAPSRLARLLAEGATVAICRGAMEFGPRALGHRSILAPAVDAAIVDVLNRRLRRTEFMPFAPVTRIEDALLEYEDVIGRERAAEFMTIGCRASNHLRLTCPAVVHVDGTARPQLVRRDADPFLHSLLDEYVRVTGVRSLINTSFNIHEEPIVASPADAVRAFLEAGLDHLYLDGWLVSQVDNLAQAARTRDAASPSASLSRCARDELVEHLWDEVHRHAAEVEERERALQELAAREQALDVERASLRVRVQTLEQAAQEAAWAAEEAAREAARVAQEAARAAQEAAHRRQREAYYRARRSLRAQLSPKLGVLDQYPPRPLSVPSTYAARPELRRPPLITMVTPSFGQATFLERTLRSVLGQDYPRLEYVVQDGGSRDGSAAILERYRARLARCVSAPDRGQAHALNLGFSGTTGELMGYLNSDDLLLPGALHEVAAAFARYPEVDVVYGHRVVIDEEDREIGRWVLPPHEDRVLTWADYVPQETLFWRRRIWDRVGGAVDESFLFALDWDLLLRFRDAGARFLRLPRFLGCFRVHAAQKTSAQMEAVGLAEMARLRERCHGRPVVSAEIHQHLRSYLGRHLVLHKLYRLGFLSY